MAGGRAAGGNVESAGSAADQNVLLSLEYFRLSPSLTPFGIYVKTSPALTVWLGNLNPSLLQVGTTVPPFAKLALASLCDGKKSLPN